MKCIACKEQISPKFVAAIKDNLCPACGDSLMSQGSYKRIFEVEKQLKGLGFNQNLIFGVAAALAGRFTLVPRDLALPEDENVEESIDLTAEDLVKVGPKKKPNRNNRSEKARREIRKQIQEAEELSDLSPETQKNIIEAYGLDKGDKDSMLFPSESVEVDVDLMDAINDIPLEGSMSGGGASNGRVDTVGASARHEALLARAASVSKPAFKRIQ